MKAFRALISCICVLAVFCLIPALAAEAPSDLPQIALTLGGQAGDGEAEGFADVLAPVYLTRSGLVFVNPRFSASDDDEEELNIGLGYRHLFAERNIIVGGNVYYDSRWTAHDNQFDQLGLGVEILTEWVDARANYYIPEDKEYLIDSRTEQTVDVDSGTVWYEPYADGHAIEQEGKWWQEITTTTYLYERFEQAREGYDAEIGVKLPVPAELGEYRVFGGFYHWDGEYVGSPEIEGFKARAEARVLPVLYVDGLFYDDKELSGTDWYVGGRLNVPFEIGNLASGKNPFAGTRDSLKRGARPFSDRLFEMVIRDLKVRTEESDWIEDMASRTVSTSVDKGGMHETLMSDIIFVDEERGADTNPGTIEAPKMTIQNGVDSAYGGRNVYVFGIDDDYDENVVVPASTQVYGEGQKIEGQGGRSFGGGNRPVVDGNNLGPTFTLNDDVLLAGFNVVNSPALGAPAIPVVIAGNAYNTERVGIFAQEANNVRVKNNNVSGNFYGMLFGAETITDVELLLDGNAFTGNDNDGARIIGRGASGTFYLQSQNNSYSANGDDGLEVNAGNFDDVEVHSLGDTFNDNAMDGLDTGECDNNDWQLIHVVDATATDNGDDGLDMELMSGNDELFVVLDGVRANGNADDGIELGANVTSVVAVIASDIQANDNGDVGMLFALNSEETAYAILGADGALFNAIESVAPPGWLPDEIAAIEGGGRVVANRNNDDNIRVWMNASNAAIAAILDFQANDSVTGDGVELNLEAPNGVAGIISAPSSDIMDLANGVLDLLGGLPIPLPDSFSSAASYGGNQANGNADGGLNWQARGFDAAFGVAYGVEASDNLANDGVSLDLLSEDGIAIGVLGDIDANRNNIRGIDVTATATDLVVLAMLDFNANENGNDGVRARLGCSDGPVFAVLGSSRSINNLAEGLLGVNLPIGNSGPNQANDNANAGVDLEVVSESIALAALLDTQANGNNNGIRVALNSHNSSAIALGMDLTANGNDNNGIRMNLLADSLALGGLLDFQANDNVAGSGVIMSMVSTSSLAIAFLGSTRSINGVVGDLLGFELPNIGLAGPNQANGNGAVGIGINAQAESTIIAAILDAQANDNNQGIRVAMNSLSGGAVAVGMDLTANDNNNTGIRMDLAADSLVLAGLLDVQANDNGADGIQANMTATNGPAIALLGSSRSLNGLAGLLGIDLPIGNDGPNRLSGNGNAGLNLNMVGHSLTLAALLDTEANENDNGFRVNMASLDSSAIALGMDLTANDNNNAGIFMNMVATDTVVAALADFTANNNQGGRGVQMNLQSLDGTAVGVLGTTRIVESLADLIGFGIDLPNIGPGGASYAGNNANDGVEMNINAMDNAVAIIADTQAGDNDRSGFDINLASVSGSGIGLLYQVTGDRNDANGYEIDIIASNSAILAMVDFEANDNANDGVRANVISTHDNAIAAFGSTEGVLDIIDMLADAGLPIGIDIPTWGASLANGNGRDGLDVTVVSDSQAIVGVFGVEANNNILGHGVTLNINSVSDDVMLGMFGVEASQNGRHGIDVTGTAASNLFALFLNTEANENQGDGLRANLNAVGGDNVFMLAGFEAEENQGRGAHVIAAAGDEVYGAVTDSRFNDNGNDGVFADMTAANDIFFYAGPAALDSITNIAQPDIPPQLVAAVPSGPVEASGNAGQGFNVQANAAGDILLGFVEVTADDNTQNGIRSVGTAGANLGAFFAGNRTTDNGVNGIQLNMSAGGNALIEGIDNVSFDNANNGVNLVVQPVGGGTVVDWGNALTDGNNSIYDNGNRDFNYVGAGIALAQGNWWGTTAPAAGQFGGAVDWSNWLLTDPND